MSLDSPAGSVSFDFLDAAAEAAPEDSSMESSELEEKVSASDESLDAPLTKESEEEVVEAEEEQEPAEEAKEPVKKAEAPKEDKSARKLKPLSVDNEGSKVDLSPEAKIQIVVDKVPTTVTLAQLRDSYASSEVNLKRHRQLQQKEGEITKRDNEIQQRSQALEGFITEFGAVAKQVESDPSKVWDLFGKIAEASNMDAYEFERTIRLGVIQDAVAYNDLHPNEKALVEARRKSKYTEDRLKREEARRTQEQTQVQTYNRIERSMQRFGVPSMEDFKSTLELIREKVDKKELVLEEDLTPEFVSRYYRGRSIGNSVLDVIEAESPGSFKNQEFVSRLVNAAVRADLDKEDIEAFVKSQLNGHVAEAVRALEEKAKDARPGSKPKPKQQTKNKFTPEDQEWV